MIRNIKYFTICFCMVLLCLVGLNVLQLEAEEEGTEDSNVSVFSVGDDGEVILVKGRTDVISDYGKVEGFEITSSDGINAVPYKESTHHTMVVTTHEGKTTEGYCMQAYMKGPGSDAFTDYRYIEGVTNSSVFSGLTELECNRWMTAYVISTKYAYGGYMADPNSSVGTNIDDGGTYGTYIVDKDGQLKAVRGLMIGGKVYEMTPTEARALTQVIVHYVGNRENKNNITNFTGHINPVDTSAAFKHLKAYSDISLIYFDKYKNLSQVAKLYDNNNQTKPYQAFKWYVYNESTGIWEEYNNQTIDQSYVDENNKIQFKVEYISKNICNKLVNNSNSKNISVKWNYQPFLISYISEKEAYYDYFTINNSSDIPIEVTYEKIKSGHEAIKNSELNGMEYEINVFSQTAYISIDAYAALDYKNAININANTGVGSAASDCYNEETQKFCTRMYSSPNVQDCLLLASNQDVSAKSGVNVSVDMSGSIMLYKVSSQPEITDDNSCYNKEGAVYEVYSVESEGDENTQNVVGRFVVDSDGKGIVTYSKYNQADQSSDIETDKKEVITKLPLGWYMVKEISLPANGSYKIDENTYYVEINKTNHKESLLVESSEEPVADPIPFEVVKKCSEGKNVGAGTLEGAEFTVSFYSGIYTSVEDIQSAGVTADRKWIFTTAIATTTGNSTCIIHKDLLQEGSDEPFLNKKGEMVLPLGTIVVEETKAPEGYLLEGARYSMVNTETGEIKNLEGPYVSPIEAERGTVKLRLSNSIIVDEVPIRADIALNKVDYFTEKPMSGIPFLISSDTTGEKHVIVTDENGVASTSAEFVLHSKDTNGNDDYNKEELLKPTGVWFVGNDSAGQVDDAKGALPYDTYTIKELPCKANEDYYLMPEFKVTVSENGKVYDCGEINNKHKPIIETEAYDYVDGDKLIYLDEKVTVADRVAYEYLDVGTTYILKGIIVDGATGEQLFDGNEGIATYVEFTPEKDKGIVDVYFEFKLNSENVGKVVVYEYLYCKETGELLAEHEDIQSESQTITVEKKAIKSTVGEPEEEFVTDVQPKTGDSKKIWLVAALMILTLISFVAMIVVRKKQ